MYFFVLNCLYSNMVQGAQENHDVLQLVPKIASLLCLTVLLCKYCVIHLSLWLRQITQTLALITLAIMLNLIQLLTLFI